MREVIVYEANGKRFDKKEELISGEQYEECANTLLKILFNDQEIQEYSKQILNMLITGEV